MWHIKRFSPKSAEIALCFLLIFISAFPGRNFSSLRVSVHQQLHVPQKPGVPKRRRKAAEKGKNVRVFRPSIQQWQPHSHLHICRNIRNSSKTSIHSSIRGQFLWTNSVQFGKKIMQMVIKHRVGFATLLAGLCNWTSLQSCG